MASASLSDALSLWRIQETLLQTYRTVFIGAETLFFIDSISRLYGFLVLCVKIPLQHQPKGRQNRRFVLVLSPLLAALCDMPSSLKLEHVGEDLVSSMLRNSEVVQRHVLGRVLTDNCSVVCELPLKNWCGRIFDGAHRVDVAIVDESTCFAIELKLGLSRMSTSAFSSRFLTQVSTSHGDKRMKGGMISILDRRWERRENDEIVAKHYPENVKLKRSWALVVRKEIADKWANSSKPNLSSNCRVIILEDLIDMYGTPDDFNKLVSNLVDGDYFGEWFVPQHI